MASTVIALDEIKPCREGPEDAQETSQFIEIERYCCNAICK